MVVKEWLNFYKDKKLVKESWLELSGDIEKEGI